MQSINLNQTFDEFNTTYGYAPLEFNAVNLGKAAKLIQDEVDETNAEIKHPYDPLNAAKELTDILYITMQQMRAMGIDIHACLEEVHRSNLSKRVPASDVDQYLEEVEVRYPNAIAIVKDHKAVLRCTDSNKIIKPSCYSPAQIKRSMVGM